MFNKLDYVITNDGQIDGILTHEVANGVWNLEYTTGTGGGNFHFHESELKKCENIPTWYEEIIDWYKNTTNFMEEK